MVPHGIDEEVWKIENRYLTDKFIFFHVGSPTQRKGGQKVVNAFIDLFADNPDVWLIMKSNGVTDCRYYDKFKNLKNVKYHERILVIEEKLDVYDLVRLYNKAHCLVYPTNGEGFGMIPFQAIATGLPTIVTDGTACSDYANLSVPLKCHPAPGIGVHLGEWVEPDEDDLRDKMLYVFNNYDEVRDKTINSAKIIHNTQTWTHTGKQIVDILGDKIFEKI
jgi:glycosyltransferase involved in cell wall biosynthesis